MLEDDKAKSKPAEQKPQAEKPQQIPEPAAPLTITKGINGDKTEKK